MTGVYLEVGKRKVFACAPRWPGLCRPGRGEEAALAALAAAAPRYAAVCTVPGVPYDAADVAGGFEILERVTGSATTDFGALDVAPELDRQAASEQEVARLVTLMSAAWEVFDEVAATAPAPLRKGRRGGGRDRAAIVAHVRDTEVLHARMLGLKERPSPPERLAGPEGLASTARIRDRIRATVLAAGAQPVPDDLAHGLRPARFVARRTAWHALDHAWEIQDRQEPSAGAGGRR